MADIFATHTVSYYVSSYFYSYLIFFSLKKYLKNTGVSKKKRVKNSVILTYVHTKFFAIYKITFSKFVGKNIFR